MDSSGGTPSLILPKGSGAGSSSSLLGLPRTSGSISFRPLLAAHPAADPLLVELRQSSKRNAATSVSPVDISDVAGAPSDEQVLLDRTSVKRAFEHQNVVVLTRELDRYLEMLEIIHSGAKKRPRSKLVAEAEDKAVVCVRDASELLVWADQNAPKLWDSFASLAVAKKMARLSEISPSRNVRFQILQTLSILVHSIRIETLRSYIYSERILNRILCADYDFTDDETLFYYIAVIRSLSCIIQPKDLLFFVERNPRDRPAFPLYSQVLRFFDHRDSIVRIAVRNVTLSLFLNGGPDVLQYAVLGSDDPEHYFRRLATRVTTISDAIVKVFVEANVKEPSTHKLLALGDVLQELRNMIEYFNEAISVSPTVIGPFLGGVLMEAIRPLIFHLTNQVKAARGKGKSGPALFAGLLVTIALLSHKMEQKVLGLALSAEIATFIDSLGYSPMYGIKAVACSARDERCVNLALCTMEGSVSSKFVSVDNLKSAQYLISRNGVDRTLGMTQTQAQIADQPTEEEEEVIAVEPSVYAESDVVDETEKHSPTASSSKPSTYRDAQAVASAGASKAGKVLSSLGNHLVHLELGNDFRVAEDIEDVLLLIFLRPSLARSGRVLQSGSRLILAIARKAGSAVACLIFVRRMLDELLENMARFLNALDGQLNGNSIESLFHMFSHSVSDRAGLTDPPFSLEKALLDPWHCVLQARHDDIRRKRVWPTMATSQHGCRQGDVDSFVVLFWLYSTLCSMLSLCSSDHTDALVQSKVESLFQAVRGLFKIRDCGIARKTKVVLGVLAMVIEHDFENVFPKQQTSKMTRTKSVFTETQAYRQLTVKIRESLDTAMQPRSGTTGSEDEDVEEILNSIHDQSSRMNDELLSGEACEENGVCLPEGGTGHSEKLQSESVSCLESEMRQADACEVVGCTEETISVDSDDLV